MHKTSNLGIIFAMKIEKTITLIRHGLTDYNERDLMQGRIDLPLSKKGMAEAELLRAELSKKEFDIILSLFSAPYTFYCNECEIDNNA